MCAGSVCMCVLLVWGCPEWALAPRSSVSNLLGPSRKALGSSTALHPQGGLQTWEEGVVSVTPVAPSSPRHVFLGLHQSLALTLLSPHPLGSPSPTRPPRPCCHGARFSPPTRPDFIPFPGWLAPRRTAWTTCCPCNMGSSHWVLRPWSHRQAVDSMPQPHREPC